MRDKFSVVDLFSGAGGLSLGFLQTQLFDIKVAFENNPNIQKTYRYNHPNVDLRWDVSAADYEEIQRKYGTIDVVIGGPPCQGFSNANRQKNHVINQNNILVKQYIRAIRELQPKAFVMENVSMLRSDIHRFYLDEADLQLVEHYNISMTSSKLILLEENYMFDGALEIVQNPSKISKYLWSEEEYSAVNIIYKAAKNPKKLSKALEKHKKTLLKAAEARISQVSDDYIGKMTLQAFSDIKDFYNGNCSSDLLQNAIAPAVMIQRMLSKASEIHNNHLVVDTYSSQGDLSARIRSYAVFDYIKAILEADPNNYAITAEILCAADYGAPQKRNRFIVMGIKKSLTSSVELPNGSFTPETYRTVRDAIGDLENIIPITEVGKDTGIKLSNEIDISVLAQTLRDSDSLHNHIITNTRDTAMKRFKALNQGQNFHALDDALKINTYTDVSRTQNTLYLRLNYEQPCGTVVNVRKSMWVHPVLDRAISIREAARLQTFPDSFIFYGTKDSQYQQVGNAVPPIMAKAIAEILAQQLKNSEEIME